LIDAHRYGANRQARSMAVRLADAVGRRLTRLNPENLAGLLRTDHPNPTNETGGWGETLYDLFELTGEPRYEEMARLFEAEWFVRPLREKRDELAGLHANTHLPIVIGLARHHERE